MEDVSSSSMWLVCARAWNSRDNSALFLPGKSSLTSVPRIDKSINALFRWRYFPQRKLFGKALYRLARVLLQPRLTCVGLSIQQVYSWAWFKIGLSGSSSEYLVCKRHTLPSFMFNYLQLIRIESLVSLRNNNYPEMRSSPNNCVIT